jgi:hypothetical protein
MHSTVKKVPISDREKAPSTRSTLKNALLDWPLYVILGVSSFLHFFRLQTTEFDFDQANLFQLAHDTVAHGLIAVSSNQASINILHAPLFIYTLLPAAALSANPLGGAITVALFAIATAALAYLFTLRYFGRVSAIVAGLLGATAYIPLNYSRAIWQPDILPFFMILFLFVIFRGAVEHKKGWFVSAVALIAILYQLHPSSILVLVVLLLLTCALAPTTLRWRDIFLAAGALILLFFPYGVLEIFNHFADIKGIIAFARLPAINNAQALRLYQVLISPFNKFQPGWMSLLGLCVQILLFAGLLIALVRLVLPRQQAHDMSIEEHAPVSNEWLQLWNDIRSHRERVSLLLLLVWQIAPFADLLHHSVDLHMQYLLLFLPGPFILMSLPFSELAYLVKRFRPDWSIVARIGVTFLTILLVIGQFTSSTAYVLKMSGGNFNDRTIQNIPYVNDLNSMWNAVHEADQLAQTKHISRIFIDKDINIQPSMTYLGSILHTPTTVFGDNNCLILPQANAGPAIYLIAPYADRVDAMLHQFASATLVDQPKRLGGNPFKLYIVMPKAPVASTLPADNFTDQLQLLEQNIHLLAGKTGHLEVTRWSIQRDTTMAPRTLYNYRLNITPGGGTPPVTTTCGATALHKNDQLLVTFQMPARGTLASQQAVSGVVFDSVPDIYHIGSIQVTTFDTKTISLGSLKTSKGTILLKVLCLRPTCYN